MISLAECASGNLQLLLRKEEFASMKTKVSKQLYGTPSIQREGFPRIKKIRESWRDFSPFSALIILRKGKKSEQDMNGACKFYCLIIIDTCSLSQ